MSGHVPYFIAEAKSYCLFIEDYQCKNVNEFLTMLQRSLIALYLAGKNLPNTGLQEDGDFEEKMDDGYLKGIISLVAERLEDKRYYMHLFNPANTNDKDLICGDLLDDICDIYIDIKQTMVALDIGTHIAIENAIWQFKFDFDNHWGDHCINAIYATHYFLRSN